MTTALGANAELSTTDVDRAEPVLAQAKLVLVTFEIPVPTALHALRRARQLGAFTILTPGPAEPLPRDALKDLDLLAPNLSEAKILIGGAPDDFSSPTQLAARLQEYFGLARVVITLGEKGALLAEGTRQEWVPAFKVAVVDTPGAGDAFIGGLAYGLAVGASLLEAARFGSLTGARAVTVRESIPGFGTSAEILEFARAHDFEIPSAVAKPG